MYDRYERKKEDESMGRGIFARIVEDVILFFICTYLIRLGISYILAVKIPLIIIAVIVGITIIAIRSHRWRRRYHDDDF